VEHTEPEANRGEHHGQKSGSVSKRTQFATVSQTIWHGRAMLQRLVQLALANWFRMSRVWSRRLVTKNFLNRPERFLRYLFSEENEADA